MALKLKVQFDKSQETHSQPLNKRPGFSAQSNQELAKRWEHVCEGSSQASTSPKGCRTLILGLDCSYTAIR